MRGARTRLLYDFGAGVGHRADHALGDDAAGQLLGQPKVRDLGVAQRVGAVAEHDVGGRQVAVHNLLLAVDVAQRQAHRNQHLRVSARARACGKIGVQECGGEEVPFRSTSRLCMLCAEGQRGMEKITNQPTSHISAAKKP